MTRIVGLVLVHNEDNFVTWAISNALDFCDEIVVIENKSTDATWQRIQALAAQHPKITTFREPKAERTNAYIQDYVGKNVWVFGIDGDEIYDPAGLARLRGRIMAGELDRCWKVRGHAVHATRVDLERQVACGYGTPDVKPATKLYNLAAIESWHPGTQRLHGTPVLKPGYTIKGSQVAMGITEPWDSCDFRMLHLCFFPRSSSAEGVEVRENVTDRSFRNAWRRPFFSMLMGMGLGSAPVLGPYLARRANLRKPLQYARGGIKERSIAGFGRPADFPLPGGRAAELEEMIQRISDRRRDDPALVP